MSSGTIYLDYLSRLACYGLDTEVKTLTLWIKLLGTQTEGAAQRQKGKDKQRDLRRGRATESRGTNVEVKAGVYGSARATRKYKRQSTHLRDKTE